MDGWMDGLMDTFKFIEIIIINGWIWINQM